MRKGEKLQDFLTGFLQGGKVVGRPCDIMKLDANSFLLTDDYSGIVYLIRKKGTTPDIAKVAEPSVSTPPRTAAETSAANSRYCLPAVIVLAGAVLSRLT